MRPSYQVGKWSLWVAGAIIVGLMCAGSAEWEVVFLLGAIVTVGLLYVADDVAARMVDDTHNQEEDDEVSETREQIEEYKRVVGALELARIALAREAMGEHSLTRPPAGSLATRDVCACGMSTGTGRTAKCEAVRTIDELMREYRDEIARHNDGPAAEHPAAPPAEPADPAQQKPGSLPLLHCASDRDGDCTHDQCPQIRDGEPEKSHRHCPLDKSDREEW